MRIHHQPRAHAFSQSEADHLPAEQIDDDSQIEPALAGPDIGDVADPSRVGGLRRELPVQ